MVLPQEESKEIQKTEYYSKFCSTIIEKLSEQGYPEHEMLQGESTIELLLRKVK